MSAVTGNPYVNASVTATSSVTNILAASAARMYVLIHNPHATNSVAVGLAGEIPAINSTGVTIPPYGTLVLDGSNGIPPRSFITAIASAATSPLTIYTVG